MNAPAECQVLIAGAGPTGLSLALDLARAGFSVRILDKASARPTTSRALGVHAGTLEQLARRGLAEKFLTAGNAARKVTLNHNSEQLAAADLSLIPSEFNLVLILPQYETERLLEEALAEAGVRIERGCELTGFKQSANGVVCEYKRKDGEGGNVRCDYLAGCDGAHSTVRHRLGFAFEGAEYEENFGLADVDIEGPLEADTMSIHYHSDGSCVFFPIGGRRFRVVAGIDAAMAERGIGIDDLRDILRARVHPDLNLSDPVWLTAFRTHRRKADRFQDRRVFLLGDAAHIHSPAGGQGMNTGMQDAFNLSWKLELVLEGMAPPTLLESYSEEREPVARHVLEMTDKMLKVAMAHGHATQQARDKILPALLGMEFVEKRFVTSLAGLDVNYRGSGLGHECVRMHVRHTVRAGDRAPNGLLALPGGEDTSLHNLLARKPGHQLLLFAAAAQRHAKNGLLEMQSLCEEAVKDFGRHLAAHWIARPSVASGLTARGIASVWHDAKDALAQIYGFRHGGVCLIRPDGYIGYRCCHVDAGDFRLHVLKYLTA